MSPSRSRREVADIRSVLIGRSIRTFVDERLAGFCVYCEGSPDTRDHVPPRVLLDKPYPENLPVVPCCRACNEGASLDEEYVACLIEVAASGTPDPSRLRRSQIARTLKRNASLAARLTNAFEITDDLVTVAIEDNRISRVVEKIARALWTFETGEGTRRRPAEVRPRLLCDFSDNELDNFQKLRPPDLLPEVGSRMMLRVLDNSARQVINSWEHVQLGRFSYAIESSLGSGRIKMIFSDFLVAEVDLADG